MPQIILKERAAHLARYTFFTRGVDQYKNTLLSHLYQSPKHLFHRILITSYVRHVNIAKFLKITFSLNTSQKQPPEVLYEKKCS